MTTSNLTACIQALQHALPAQALLTDPAECWVYGSDNSRLHHPPDAVALPENDAMVARIVQIAYAHGVPITPRGRATATTGAAVPIHGGICLSFERMNQILDVDLDNRTLTAQAGVLNQTIQDTLHPHGFFWPPDPSSSAYCTLGGNIGCNAGGPRAIRYGTTRDHVLCLTAVTGSGEIFQTGAPVTKLSAGYDLTRLIVGSEGTLAVVISATLKISPLPEAHHTIQLLYAHLEGACQAICQLMKQNPPPALLEFIDEQALNLIRPHLAQQGMHLDPRAKALLLIRAEGTNQESEAQSNAFIAASNQVDRLSVTRALSREQEQQLWQTRKVLSQHLREIAPKKINEDVVVPVTQIPRLLQFIETLSKQSGFPIVNFGHAGNGNIHVNLLIDPGLPGVQQQAEACLKALFTEVVACQGSVSGEHGIGLMKKNELATALDPVTWRLMKAIKQSWDPKGILNPGKIFI